MNAHIFPFFASFLRNFTLSCTAFENSNFNAFKASVFFFSSIRQSKVFFSSHCISNRNFFLRYHVLHSGSRRAFVDQRLFFENIQYRSYCSTKALHLFELSVPCFYQQNLMLFASVGVISFLHIPAITHCFGVEKNVDQFLSGLHTLVVLN